MANPDRNRDPGADWEFDRGRPEDWYGYGFGRSRDYDLPYAQTTHYGYAGNPSYGADVPDYSHLPSQYHWRDDFGPYFGGYAGRAPAGTVDHRGRGPRNYKRSDERIFEDVAERLTDSPDVDASDIEVNVSNGEVTLSGSVMSRHEKRIACLIADEVNGVIDVQNQLRIRVSDDSRR